MGLLLWKQSTGFSRISSSRRSDAGSLGTEVFGRSSINRTLSTTAYAQHAVTGFELGALDYLLKPFGRDRLASAMDRVRAAIGGHRRDGRWTTA